MSRERQSAFAAIPEYVSAEPFPNGSRLPPVPTGQSTRENGTYHACAPRSKKRLGFPQRHWDLSTKPKRHPQILPIIPNVSAPNTLFASKNPAGLHSMEIIPVVSALRRYPYDNHSD
jgi:hypothetical protein